MTEWTYNGEQVDVSGGDTPERHALLAKYAAEQHAKSPEAQRERIITLLERIATALETR